MVEFLVAAMQGLCIIGLLCGAYFSITYASGQDDVRERTPASRPRVDYDPVTTHAWHACEERSRRVRA